MIKKTHKIYKTKNDAIIKMITDKFRKLFGRPEREPESDISQFEMDIAKSIQDVLDEVAVYVSSTVQDRVMLPKHVAEIMTEKTEIPIGEI
ncbi:MAG: hypothetical protein COB75_08295, partial [Idiomarina sp.]